MPNLTTGLLPFECAENGKNRRGFESIEFETQCRKSSVESRKCRWGFSTRHRDLHRRGLPESLLARFQNSVLWTKFTSLPWSFYYLLKVFRSVVTNLFGNPIAVDLNRIT